MKDGIYWKALRLARDKFLSETDKTQLSDFPVDTKTRGLFREYRQYLRDCPNLFDDNTIRSAKVKTFEEWRDWKKNSVY